MKNETNPHLEESIAEAEAIEAKARKYYKKFYAEEFSSGAYYAVDVNELIEDEVALELETYERLFSHNKEALSNEIIDTFNFEYVE